MRIKKLTSLLLSALMLLSIVPFEVIANAAAPADSYATVITASDFQSSNITVNYLAILRQIVAAGYTDAPDAILCGGDYNGGSGTATDVQKIFDDTRTIYPDMTDDKFVIVQGNHDDAHELLTPSGFHEFQDFVVYSINEDDFKTSQSGRTAYDQVVQARVADIRANLENMVATGDTRPVFVITHVPFHHSSRSSYGDNLYSKYIVDVLNEMGQYLDIISLFGHNHSSDYDDYIGGSVNYIAKGETMRVPIPDTAQQGATGYTEETLNFTYMNCGYVGYSSNANSGTSTNVLTAGVFDLCPTTIEISRYSSSGLYVTETIERINPQTSDPYANIGSDITDAVIGCSDVIYGKVANFTEPTYTWTSSNPDAVEVLGAGKNAQILYKGAGEATVTLTVTGSDGLSATDSIQVTVSGGTVTVIPGETYYTYDYVDTPTSGEEYVIVNTNTAGSASAMGSTISNNTVSSESVEVLSDGNTLYIENPASTALWTLTTNTKGGFAFTNNSTNTSLKAAKNRKISFAGTNTGNADQAWLYQNGNLYNSNQKCYINGYFAAASSASGNLYFYQKTEHTTEETTEVIKPDYDPVITLTRVNEDVSGKKLSYYEITPGDTLMLGGAYSGFSDKGSAVTTTWSSSDTSVATVQNGLITFLGSGDTTITYTVSDGETTLTKSVNLSLSRARKPVFSYKLTDTIEDGKSYLIASTNVAGATSIMSNLVAGTDNNRLTLVSGIVTEDENGVPTITSDVDSIVYNAVGDGNGNLYIVNDETGKYLFVNSGNLFLLSQPDLSGTYCYFGTTDGHLASKNGAGYGPHISGDGNFRTSWGDTPIKNYIYERVISDPFVTLKKNGVSVAGKSETIYSVTSGTSLTLVGDYMNFGESVTAEWISSDPSIATVENGVVTFTGKEGTVDITYHAVDENGSEAAATVAYTATTAGEPVRVFKPVTTFTQGRNYIIVNSNSVGAAYYMNNTSAGSGTRLGQTYAVIQPDEADNSVFIEIPVASGGAGIWTAAEAGTDGYVTLQNEDNSQYLSLTYASAAYATLTTASAVSSSDSDPFAFTVDSNGKVSGLDANASGTRVVIRYSGDGNFRGGNADDSERSGVYLFEETVLTPAVHIRSMYQNIDDTVAKRKDVCKWQTETLLPRPVNFATEDIAYTWKSSNPDVATIDENGVVTYTGAGGETVITLTATSRVADADGSYPTATSTTTLKVIPNTLSGIAQGTTRYVLTDHFEAGKYYAFNMTATSGATSYPMNCYTYTSSSSGEKRLYSNPNITIEANGDTVYFDCDDESIKWECIATDTDGVFKFYNEYKGYLILDFATGSPRFVTTSGDLSSYSDGADLISYNSANHRVYSVDSRADGNYMSYNSGYEYRLSSAPEAIYIYAASDNTIAVEPTVQIRIDAYGGNKDITNVLQNRYEVYPGMTERLLSYVTGLENTTVTWVSDNTNIASVDNEGLVTYTGLEGFASITMTVTGTDASGETVTRSVRTTLYASPEPYTSPIEDYPEYPHEGSVRIDKTASGKAGGYDFQTSGVTEVELSVTGVPMTQPVDVVIVFDHSSSMNSNNRLANAIEDTREFALQLVNKNKSNRIAIVTFDKYINDYGTFDSATPNYNSDTSSNENRIITGDGTPGGAFVGIDDAEKLVSQIDSLQYNNTPGTNYDDGLEKCYQILKASQNDPNANKKKFVVFMSDGEPYAFNRLVIKYNTEDPDGAYAAWLTGDETNTALATYLADPATYPVANYFNTDGNNWFAEAIKAPLGSEVDLPAVSYYDGYRTGLGATVFSIGYSSDAGTNLATGVLQRIASSTDNFYYAESDLQVAYDQILESILYAANNAVVTDTMGEDYNLQFAQSFSLGNGQATIALDPAPYIEIGSWTLNSDGSRNEYTVRETITFTTNENGNLTAAYSTQIDNGTTNIYDVAANQIVGRYVTYNLLTEQFTWTIGDITRDEITLKYYAYLTGSAEGKRAAGVYDTNESATLVYNNYLDNPCRQTFPIPALGWKEAVVNYEFYLVNEYGQPVNSDGVVVPFEERVLVGNRQAKELMLNSAGELDAYNLYAKENLPDMYTLYNENAYYTIKVSSGENPSSAVIHDEGKDVVTTYFYEGTYTYNQNGEVPNASGYTNTNVAFAVLYLPGILPDAVVIDYGLPVRISVLANDMIKNGTLTAIGTSVLDGTVLNNTVYTESRLTDPAQSLTLENGTAEILNRQIVYTPSNMTMSTENVFYYEFKTASGSYFYTTVTVIPAANIYYEDSFFTFNDSVSYQWVTEGTTYTDKFQAEDRPGTFSLSQYDANNAYGCDAAYNDSAATYSLGSAKSVVVDQNSIGKEPTAEFTFSGTGFELFSVTNAQTGAMMVAVYDTATGKRIKNYVVQTYYGYSYDSDTGEFTPDPTSVDGLYQIPVIRARGFSYGTYRVVITPKYGKVFDPGYDENATDNSYKVYIDSVRIYDPAGEAPLRDSVIGDAYISDKEYTPQYIQLRDNVLSAETFYDSTASLPDSQFVPGSVFIDGISSLDDTGLSDNYKKYGPNNELYLAKGQAVAFYIQSDRAIEPASLQLGMKLAAGQTEGTLLCMNTDQSEPTAVTVSGSHEMYRRLTGYVVWDETYLEQGIYRTKYPIVLINNSDAVISLTNFKWTYAEEETTEQLTGLSLAVTASTPQIAMMTFRRVTTPQPEAPVFAPTVSMTWQSEAVKQNSEAVLLITTSIDVTKVTVDGDAVTECAIDENGQKLWTYTYRAEKAGEVTCSVICYNEQGEASEATTSPVLQVTAPPTLAEKLLGYLEQFLTLIRKLIAFWRNLL